MATIQMSPPNDTAVDPKAHAVYLSDDAGTVSVLDTDRHEVVRRISVLGGSDGLAVDSGAGRLYVAHEGSGDSGAVSVINTRSLKVIKTIRLGKGGAPNGLAFDPSTNRLFTVHDGHVTVVDTDRHTVLRSIPVRDGGFAVAVDSAGLAFVTGDRRVSAIDTKTLKVKKVITVAGGGRQISVDPTTRQAFLCHEADGFVTVINTTTLKVAKTITVGGPYGPFAVVIDPSAGRGYVTGAAHSLIEVVDNISLEVVEEIPHPDPIWWSLLAVDPSTGQLYIGTQDAVLVVVPD